MINWKRLFRETLLTDNIKDLDTHRHNVIMSVKKTRTETNKKIEDMIAQINGCGDRWFLQPRQTIDDCDGKKMNGEQ